MKKRIGPSEDTLFGPEKHPRAVRLQDLVVGHQYLLVLSAGKGSSRTVTIEKIEGDRIFYSHETSEWYKTFVRKVDTATDNYPAADRGAVPYGTGKWNQWNRFEEIS